MRLPAFAVLVLVTAGSASPQDESVPLPDAEMGRLKERAAGDGAFAVDLYRQFAAEKGNLFFSPFSITSALGMTGAGARGETAAEMTAALHFDMLSPEAHHTLGTLTRHFSGRQRERNGYELAIANRLWGQKGFPFLADYLALTDKAYGAGLQQVDFEKETEPSRLAINAWVEAQTREKIRDLLPPGVLTTDTRLVLTNAVYFKGDWKTKFDKTATKQAPFFIGLKESVKADLMSRNGEFRYAESEDRQILELPYKGDELSMVFLLPRDRDGLGKIETGLSFDRMSRDIESLRNDRDVQLFLPRFHVAFETSLKEALARLGLRRAFEPEKADFSGMTGNRDLFVSAAVHKAFVEVNEEGTEAAAATGVVAGITSVKPTPAVFRADHPFLFLIRHKATGTILFMGRVMKP